MCYWYGLFICNTDLHLCYMRVWCAYRFMGSDVFCNAAFQWIFVSVSCIRVCKSTETPKTGMVCFCFQRFIQCLASNNCTFNLGSFADKSGTQGEAYLISFAIKDTPSNPLVQSWLQCDHGSQIFHEKIISSIGYKWVQC